MIFGVETVVNVMGKEPDSTQPAAIAYLVLTIPCMLLGAVGGLFGVVVPLYYKFGVDIGGGSMKPPSACCIAMRRGCWS